MSLLGADIDSNMLVQEKSSTDFNVLQNSSKFYKIFSKLRPYLDAVPTIKYKKLSLFSPAWVPYSGMADFINASRADVVHLHWVAGGMLRFEDILKIKAPIVWTLHDNWVYTGGCHVSFDCKKYLHGCSSCPVLNSDSKKDLSTSVFNRKLKVFSKRTDIKFVGVSKWITDCAQESFLLKNHDVICIGNPIDTSIFCPYDKTESRKLLKLPLNKKLIAFGAMCPLSDLNKGFENLYKALNSIVSEDFEIVIFGASKPKIPQGFNHATHYMGLLNDDISLRLLYSSVDVMVVPSYQESFGQTASESMACGTPVVCFDTTGLKDIVVHKKTGYLAKPFDSIDLAYGIVWILNLSYSAYLDMSNNSREKIINEFDYESLVHKYIDVYESTMLNK